MAFTAKFSGTCANCGGRILAGQVIEAAKNGGKWQHAGDCRTITREFGRGSSAVAPGTQFTTEANDEFNRRWVEMKNEYAAHEREQEAAAFMSDPDFLRDEEQLVDPLVAAVIDVEVAVDDYNEAAYARHMMGRSLNVVRILQDDVTAALVSLFAEQDAAGVTVAAGVRA